MISRMTIELRRRSRARRKLTNGQVTEIRLGYSKGEAVAEIAARYGVSSRTIYKLLGGARCGTSHGRLVFEGKDGLGLNSHTPE